MSVYEPQYVNVSRESHDDDRFCTGLVHGSNVIVAAIISTRRITAYERYVKSCNAFVHAIIQFFSLTPSLYVGKIPFENKLVHTRTLLFIHTHMHHTFLIKLCHALYLTG